MQPNGPHRRFVGRFELVSINDNYQDTAFHNMTPHFPIVHICNPPTLEIPPVVCMASTPPPSACFQHDFSVLSPVYHPHHSHQAHHYHYPSDILDSPSPNMIVKPTLLPDTFLVDKHHIQPHVLETIVSHSSQQIMPQASLNSIGFKIASPHYNMV